jgi:hypothetical protein
VENALKTTEELLARIRYITFLKKNGKYFFVDSVTINHSLKTNEYGGRAFIDSYELTSVELNDKWGVN